VFTWDATKGQYVNATYGNLLDMTYTSSASANDLTDLSFSTTNNAAYATDEWGCSPYGMSATSAFNYIGTATFSTQSVGTASADNQATPDEICSVAAKFVGDAWD